MKDNYPTTKEIVKLLGIGTLLLGSVLMPGLGGAAWKINKYFKDIEIQKSKKLWLKFNEYALKRNLKRLLARNIIKISQNYGEEVVQLTDKGEQEYFKQYLKDQIEKNIRWDRKWRLVIYDIAKFKRNQQEMFRRMLKYMRFLKLQKSVYVTPYDCSKEITIFRQYFNLNDEVMVIRADRLENEEVYKKYFGL